MRKGRDWGPEFDALARMPGAKVMGINLGALQPPDGRVAPHPLGRPGVHQLPGLPIDPGPDPPKRPSKYRNVRTEYAGVLYDSQAEARRAEYLLTLERAGALDWVLLQPPFRLGCPENRYRADFLVSEGGQVRAEDVKGQETKDFRRVRRLWRAYGRMPLWVIRGGDVEVLMPGSLDDGMDGPESG